METNENDPINEIPQGNQEMCESNPIVVLEKAPENDQPTSPPVPVYSNVSIMPYRSSWYTHYF